MKLRNKKTGGIWDIPKMRHPTMQEDDISFFAYGKDEGCLFSYHSLAELNEEWEDYKPKEPLNKDKKVRKAVRAWLAIQEQPIVAVAITRTKDNDGFFNYRLYGYIEKARISGGKPVVNNNLTAIDFEFRSLEKIEFEQYRDYTIAELCGEEEE